MENQVIMALNDYNVMRETIQKQHETILELDRRFNSLNIFRIEENFSGDLNLCLTTDAQQFIDKVFAKYKDGYTYKDIDRLYIYDFAQKITVKDEQPKQEVF